MNRRYGKIDIAYNISLDSNMPLLSLSESIFLSMAVSSSPFSWVGLLYSTRKRAEINTPFTDVDRQRQSGDVTPTCL